MPDEREIRRLFAAQQVHRLHVRQTTARERGARLKHLEDVVLRRRDAIRHAMLADFRKPGVETDLSEVGPLLAEIRYARRHLASWMRPRKVGTPKLLLGTRSEVHVEPRGVVLVMAPWNYPLLLTLGPLVSAVAAGNCVTIKPSEHAPATARVVREVLAEVFEPREVAVVEGGEDEARTLLGLPFDHIYFTGSTAVGRIVMKAAAEHLTPVTLELGGKSPALVDTSADLRQAAARIVWGRFSNAGQTCIAPDYVLVHRSVEQDLLRHLQQEVARCYGSGRQVAASEDYARLINEQHFARVRALLDDALQRGARAVTGGWHDAPDRLVAPTVLTDVPLDADVMQQEIFGPLLPVIPYDQLSDAVDIIEARTPPLVQYVFGADEALVERVLKETRAGATVVDDTLVHFMHPELPFGGVGESGMGRGHGHAGFMTFSNERAVLRRVVGSSVLRLLTPPYGRVARSLIRRLLRLF